MLLGENFGGNIDMTGDGHIGVEKAICEKICIAQKKQQQNRNISQLLGLKTYLVNLFVVF